MTKTYLRTLLTGSLLAGLLGWGGAATTTWAVDAGDDFDDGVVDVTKWGSDELLGNGSLTETNEHLEFTVSKGTKFDEARRPWVLTQFPTTEDWDIVINVVNNPELGKNQVISAGMYIRNWTDPFDNISAELYGSTLGGGPTRHGFYSSLFTDDQFVDQADSFDLATTVGAIRVGFDSTNQVLSVYYDANPGNGLQWVLYASYGINGAGGFTANTDWNMGEGDRFALVLYGYGGKATITANSLYCDEVETTHGVNYLIPPSTLTGTFSGVKQKCKTTCSVKGKLAMLNGTTSPVADTRIRIFLSADQVYNEGIDSLVGTSQTGLITPGKAKKLKVAAANETSLTGMYLLAVDDSGAVVGTLVIP